MPERIRIGVLSYRTGVSTHLLRVWEERYGLLRPTRSPGGYRLYGPEDEERIRAVLALRSAGLATAEAASVVLDRAGRSATARPLPELALRLYPALTGFDEDQARALLDQAIQGYPLPQLLRGLVFPILQRLGDDWESGRISIAHEHYASGLLRERLVALAERSHEAGMRVSAGAVPLAPLAVLACPSFERHDIPLVAFDLLLREAGWRVCRLGADTPVPAAIGAARAGRARALVLSGFEAQVFAAQLEQHAADLAARPSTCLLALAGPAATPDLAERVGAKHLAGDPQAAVAVLDLAAGSLLADR